MWTHTQYAQPHTGAARWALNQRPCPLPGFFLEGPKTFYRIGLALMAQWEAVWLRGQELKVCLPLAW